MTASPPESAIVRVDPERTTDAMSALLGAGPTEAARFVQRAKGSSIRLDLMWCVTDAAGRYRLAVLAVPSMGRASMLLSSHARNDEEIASLGRAIAAAAEGCRDESDIAQALVDPAFELDVRAFEAGGLRRMAVLDYLERQLPRSGTLPAPELPDGWTIVPAAPRSVLDGDDPALLGPECRRELIALLESTYIDTQDCPGLAGMRATGDVLDGHFGSGARRRNWLVAREHGVARGVCMLNTTADGSAAELVYFGLSPHARGKGLGRTMLAAGLHACSRDRAPSVSLAVDTRNAAAKKLYEESGFRKTASRVALVKRL